MEMTAKGAEIARQLGISSQEKRIVDYHYNTIKTGKTGKDEFGRPVTVYSTGIRIPEGEKFSGLFVSVPGFVNGKVVTDERQLYKHWKSDIDKGKWPTYQSGAELNARSQAIHRIMDADEGMARSKQ